MTEPGSVSLDAWGMLVTTARGEGELQGAHHKQGAGRLISIRYFLLSLPCENQRAGSTGTFLHAKGKTGPRVY